MSSDTLKELPPRYYLTYFEYLLTYVKDKYASVLIPEELHFIEKFAQLSAEARCLFVRFSNRRIAFFRLHKLDYPEIGSLDTPLGELLSAGFARLLCPEHAPQAHLLLDVYTREELLEIGALLQPGSKKPSKLKKTELLHYIIENIAFDELQQYLNSTEKVVRRGAEKETEFLRFLFFGNVYDDMTQFVIRDLGNARFEQFDDAKLTPYFRTRREAEDKLHVTKAYQFFKDLCQVNYPAEEIFNWFLAWSAQNPIESTTALPVFDKIVLKLGALLEKKQLPEQALRAYQYTTKPPSRERQVRLWHKAGFTAEAAILCKKMMEHAANAEEQIFAADFINKLENKKSRKSTTNHLQEAETIFVDMSFKYQVEQGVIHYFEQRGQRAMIAENYLWRSLFGLLLWEVLFDEEAQAIHQPLQRVPSDLYSADFLEKRKTKIEQQLSRWDTAQQMKTHIERIYTEKFEMVNPLVGWHESLLPLSLACCEKLGAEAVKTVLMAMAANLKENTRGFPDLLTWNDNDYCFVEVKSPTDSLSAQQLYWLRFFGQAGIKAKVLRVAWAEV